MDNSDELMVSYTYESYGKTNQNKDFVNSLAYTGAVVDAETQLYYMNARYYDPEIGTFINQDSYRGETEGLWNLYMYCEGDPVNYIDPTGNGFIKWQWYGFNVYLSNKETKHLINFCNNVWDLTALIAMYIGWKAPQISKGWNKTN